MGLFDKFLGKTPASQAGAPPAIPPSAKPPPPPDVQTEEKKASLRQLAERQYHKAARLILVGIRQHEDERVEEGVELLVQCENLAPDFIDPLKLSYRVMWSRMSEEGRAKALLIDRRRHETTEKLEFLDRLEDGQEAFEDRPDLWQQFVEFVEALPETQEIHRQVRGLCEEASQLIKQSCERKLPAQVLLPDALRKILEAVKLDHDDIDAWKLYCKLTYAVYAREKQEEMISEETEWAYGNPEKLQFLAELAAGKHPLYQREQSSPRDAAEAAYCEAVGLREKGNQDGAVEKLKLALSLNPEHVRAQIAMAWGFSNLEQWDSSVLHVNNALHLAKEKEDIQDAHQAAFTSYCGKANRLQSQERWLEAMVFFKKAVFLDLKNDLAEAAFNRMWLLEAKPGCRDLFVETCKDALAIAPQWTRVRFWLGRSLINMMTVARSQEALPYLEEAVRRAPDELDGHEWLFLAYSGSKEFAKARKEFEVLRRMNSKKIDEWAILVRDEGDPPIDDAIFRKLFSQN